MYTKLFTLYILGYFFHLFLVGGYTTPYYATLFRGHIIKAIGYKSTLQKRDIDINLLRGVYKPLSLNLSIYLTKAVLFQI
jgi:hypothetical protein